MFDLRIHWISFTRKVFGWDDLWIILLFCGISSLDSSVYIGILLFFVSNLNFLDDNTMLFLKFVLIGVSGGWRAARTTALLV
jgi:hypothetical protein